MSEGNERNLEGITPEAAENIQEQPEQAAEQISAPAAEVQPDLDDRENAPGPQHSEPKKGGKKKKREDEDEPQERKGRGVAISVAIVLAALLLIIGVFVGIRLGPAIRQMFSSRQEEVQEQPSEPEDIFAAGLEAIEDIPAFDEFAEAQTGENQRALDALSGADGFFDEGASALMGENGLFGGEFPEDDSSENAAEPVVVAEFGDGQQLLSDEVLAEYSSQLSLYILSGYSESEVAETLLDNVMRSMVGQRVLKAHAEELGLDELDDEDHAAIDAQAANIYDQYLTYYKDSVVDTQSMSDAEADDAARTYLLDYEGITLETIAADLEQNWWERKIYAYITDSVTVDDAAVQAAYDARLADQKKDFDEYPFDYEFSQGSGELIVYNLPGYRAVKMLMLNFESDETIMNIHALSEEMSALSGAAADAFMAEHQAELDGYYAESEVRAAELLDQLRAGADMDALILSEGADAGMMDERRREMGYYVSANSVIWPVSFIEAAMAIENVGDYSEPVRTANGVCILQYLGDVPEGEVPLAEVRAILEQETLAAAQEAAYDAQVTAWVEETNPSFYPERMQ